MENDSARTASLSEQEVLGCVLSGSADFERIRDLAHCFQDPANRAIALAMRDQAETGEGIDTITIVQRLEAGNYGQHAPDLSHLGALARSALGSNFEAHCDAVRKAWLRHERGRILTETAGGTCDDDAIGRMRADLDRLGLCAQPEAAGLISIGDLLEEEIEATSWAVAGLLPAGGLSLLLGKPKAGKSTLARCLCKAVADGGRWLGRQCEAGPVVYLALEEKRAEVRRHFESLGVQSDDGIFVYCDRLPPDVRPVEWLTAMIQARSIAPALIVIDPLARFVSIRDGGNDYMDATKQLEPLISYVRDSKAQTHIALVHHSRKAAGEHGDESLGSTAILGSVDAAISLKREKDSHRSVYSINRYGEDLPESIVTLDAGTGWVSLGATKAEAAAKGCEDAILDFVAGREESVAHKDILAADGVTGRTATVQRAIHGLVDSGRLHRTGSGRRNDPFRYSFPVSDPL